MGTRGSFLGVKVAQDLKMTTHSHVAPRLIMLGAIPPLPQYVFMAWGLIKHRDSFTFT
jgi:hypothetical protein